jgi:hypothetical protein
MPFGSTFKFNGLRILHAALLQSNDGARHSILGPGKRHEVMIRRKAVAGLRPWIDRARTSLVAATPMQELAGKAPRAKAMFKTRDVAAGGVSSRLAEFVQACRNGAKHA